MTEAAGESTPSEANANPGEAGGLSPDDELGIPKPRRLMHTLAEEEGAPCLFLYYGIKEICFDDPRLIPFGRGLLDHARFRAAEACGWAEGEPYGWEEVRELLEILVQEEVLVPAADLPDPVAAAPRNLPVRVDDAEPSDPGERATWSRHQDRCPYLTAEIFGHSQGSAHLEFLIPGHRIAHPAFDRDGRQVGEANVYPPQLKARVPTEWRTCPYEGSRYQDERPMNISALRSMSEHWADTLGHTLEARDHLLRRAGLPVDEDLSLGDLYLLSLFLLAIPAYMLHRPREPLANGELPVAVASMFRVTDGVRFSIEHMIHGHGAEVRGLEDVLDPRTFLEVVEQECLFLGVHGVCAGPAPRVLELLEAMIGGRGAGPESGEGRSGLDGQVRSLDAALAYAVLTTWMTAVLELFWHRTGTVARDLGEAASRLRASPDCPRPDVPGALRRLGESHRLFQTAPPRLRRPEVLGALIRRCAGLAGTSLLDPARGESGGEDGEDLEAAAAVLRRFLAERKIPSELPEGTLEALAPALLRAADQERRALAVCNRLQQRINQLLERPAMERPIDRRDLIAHGRNLAGAAGTGAGGAEDPPGAGSRRLVTEVAEELLGLGIELGEDATVVRHGDARVTLDVRSGEG